MSAQEAPGERAAVTAAIRSTANLNAAARRLDVARKTLYNRMREYQLPPGRAGRPRYVLPMRPTPLGVLTLAGVFIGAGLGMFLIVRSLQAKTEPVKLTGLDLLGAR